MESPCAFQLIPAGNRKKSYFLDTEFYKLQSNSLKNLGKPETSCGSKIAIYSRLILKMELDYYLNPLDVEKQYSDFYLLPLNVKKAGF